MPTRVLLLVLTLSLPADAADPSPVQDRLRAVNIVLDREIDDLVGLYQHLHSHPELSLNEHKTAARMAEELNKAGFAVTRNVGGTGVVGVFKNGDGPTILVRTDMDALPVAEQTGVPYASKVRVRDKAGNEVGVMHACGHDVHMSYWVGTARTLTTLKDRWAGTLVFIAQPAEEIGAGAKAMLADGLFEKFPKPDYALALHAEPRLPAGVIAYSEGLALANVDSVDITVKGKGGHGAAPHGTIDPVVLAARIVLDLQTIASREVNPVDPVVVTVGSIHGGTKHNIIPNEVHLQLTVRTTKDSVRDHVLKAIDRIAKAAAVGARAPEPTVVVNLDEYTPSTYNDVELTRRSMGVLREVLGDENVQLRDPIMGGEDFGRYGRAGVPICMYFLGTISREKYEAAQRPDAPLLPGMHSDGYAPAPEPSIRAGVRTMASAVLDLMAKPATKD